MTITELAAKYNCDKKMNDGKKAINGVFGHNYAQYYDEILPTVNVKTMLEIGVRMGNSIMMWHDYFPEARIFGLDIKEWTKLDLERFTFILADQSKKEDLIKIDADFDFIVDDGSHKTDHQLLSFKLLWWKLNKGGLYVVEDLHVSDFKNQFIAPPDAKSITYYENNKICFIRKHEKY